MDKIDRQIVKALQKNGRLTNQDLSEQVNLSPSPCLRRLKALEDKRVIVGYTAIVDEMAYGLPITAFIRIRLQSHVQSVVDEFEKKVRALDSILDCYVMTGDTDYLLRVLVESLQDYEKFVRGRLHLLPGIAAIETSFAYGVIKRSPVFPALG